jgi:hypothetical protein
MPYWATLSYPDFHTRVTSQAFVACNRHDKKADTALPPTIPCQQKIRLDSRRGDLVASMAGQVEEVDVVLDWWLLWLV